MIKTVNLLDFLAESALKERFEKPRFDSDEAKILAYCGDHCSLLCSQRVAYVFLLRHINRIIVDSVLSALSSVSRKIIVLKYAKKMSITKISLECGLSVARIVALDHDVREEIQNMLFYTLISSDVYNRSKVANMVHILDLLLGFMERCPEFAASVSRDWIHLLDICRENYRCLYTMIEETIRNQDSNLRCKVISTKFLHPDYTLKEISTICHVSQSGICRHLQSFETKVSKYLIA